MKTRRRTVLRGHFTPPAREIVEPGELWKADFLPREKFARFHTASPMTGSALPTLAMTAQCRFLPHDNAVDFSATEAGGSNLECN